MSALSGALLGAAFGAVFGIIAIIIHIVYHFDVVEVVDISTSSGLLNSARKKKVSFRSNQRQFLQLLDRGESTTTWDDGVQQLIIGFVSLNS